MVEFEKFLTKLKEYLPIIILVPTLLGSILQIIKLYSISFSHIRFFSISQVISDGVLCLIALLIYALISAFTFYITIFLSKKMFNLKITSENKFLSILIIFLENFIINTLIYTPFITFFFLYFNYSLDLKGGSILIVILITFSISSTLFNCLKRKIRDSKKTEIINNNHKHFFLIILITAFVSPIYLIAYNDHSRLIEIKNKENINCLIKKTYPESEGTEILYVNDKYIFIEISNKNKIHENLVLKFDTIFNFKACK